MFVTKIQVISEKRVESLKSTICNCNIPFHLFTDYQVPNFGSYYVSIPRRKSYLLSSAETEINLALAIQPFNFFANFPLDRKSRGSTFPDKLD